MTTLEDLLALESSIENAWCAILGENAYPEFSDRPRATPCFEVRLQGLGATDARRPGGKLQPRQWKGVLITRVVTRRFKNSEKHPVLLGFARAQAFNFTGLFNSTTLPDLLVTWLKEQPGTRQHLPGESPEDPGYDITELHFEIIFEVRDTAWPAAL